MGEIETLEHGTGSPSEPSMFRTHKVSSVDSLAGLAIKYGVTISDIRRANGGTITDQTMFARGTVSRQRKGRVTGVAAETSWRWRSGRMIPCMP
jgi:hypothetical protein